MNIKTPIFWMIIIMGYLLRLWTSTLGYNFDLESYWLVSDEVIKGKSVYASTHRYNYGPIWFLLLGCFRQITIALGIDSIFSFHTLIAGFLSFVDITIALILRKQFGTGASLFFFLNPVSILITGYHSQFDNFAILIALVGCLHLSKNDGNLNNRAVLFSTLALGLSLATKHVLLFFPIWLWWAYRNAPVKVRGSIIFVPYGVFALMLLPFALDEKSISGIVENVLKYGGNYGSGLIFHLLDLFLDINLVEKYFNVSLTKGLFALVTVMSGIFWFSNSQHRDNEFELLLIYLITLVALTCSVVDQYLAIPIVALARYHTHWSGWLYSIIATGLLLTSSCNVFSFNYSEPLFIRYQHAQIWLLILLVVIWRQWRSDELSSMRTDVHKNREL